MSPPSHQDARQGNSDEAPNKVAVDGFLAGLSPWELIYLRQRLLKMNIAGLRSLEDLPLEIVCQIAEHLNPEDLFCAAQVSQGWRTKFASDAVIEMACSNLFPGLRESHEEETGLWRLLQEIYRLYGRLPAAHPGPWRFNWSTNPTDTIDDMPDGSQPLTFYSHGKLVYQWEDRMMLADIRKLLASKSISSATGSVSYGSIERLVAPADRRKTRGTEQIVAMSRDILVIAQSSNQVKTFRTLAILLHSAEGNPQWKTIILPSALVRCYAEAERVVVTCVNGQAFHWYWGKGLEELPVWGGVKEITENRTLKLVSGQPGAIFHPQKGNVCYLAYVYGSVEQDEPDLKYSCPEVHVVKYERDELHTWRPSPSAARWTLDCQKSLESHHSNQIKGREEFDEGTEPDILGLLCAKVDKVGSYSLAVHCCKSRRDARYTLGSTVCFNVLTESFFIVPWFGKFHRRISGLLSPLSRSSASGEGQVMCTWNRTIISLPGSLEQDNDPHVGITTERLAIVVRQPQTEGLHWVPFRAQPAVLRFSGRVWSPFALHTDDDFVVYCDQRGYYILAKGFQPSGAVVEYP